MSLAAPPSTSPLCDPLRPVAWPLPGSVCVNCVSCGMSPWSLLVAQGNWGPKQAGEEEMGLSELEES